jgi:hypothetical protein
MDKVITRQIGNRGCPWCGGSEFVEGEVGDFLAMSPNSKSVATTRPGKVNFWFRPNSNKTMVDADKIHAIKCACCGNIQIFAKVVKPFPRPKADDYSP